MSTLFLLVMMIVTPDGRQEFVIDSGLTQDDCMAALASAPSPYQHYDFGALYVCHVEGQ